LKGLFRKHLYEMNCSTSNILLVEGFSVRVLQKGFIHSWHHFEFSIPNEGHVPEHMTQSKFTKTKK